MKNEDRATELFEKGFSCSQAVFAAYCRDLGMDEATALKIAAPFRAGMGRLGKTCGAVTGAFMALGLKFGDNELGRNDQRDRICALVQELEREFSRRNKTSVCSELVGFDMSVPEERAKAAEKGLFKTLCPKLVRDAAEIVGMMLEGRPVTPTRE